MISTDTVHAQATAILNAVALHMASQGNPAPERRYVSTGIPAVDCEQLVIQIREIQFNLGNAAATGSGGGPQLPLLSLPAVAYAIHCHRCVPMPIEDGISVTLPTAAAEDAASRDILADGNHITAAVVNLEADASTETIPQRGLLMQTWEALNHEGGYGGGVCYFIANVIERA